MEAPAVLLASGGVPRVGAQAEVGREGRTAARLLASRAQSSSCGIHFIRRRASRQGPGGTCGMRAAAHVPALSTEAGVGQDGGHSSSAGVQHQAATRSNPTSQAPITSSADSTMDDLSEAIKLWTA
uniref:Uncharacterized protein n=1 Tax=Oryza rufipogon TaxID=4529 RepID=A0A0E0P5S8_ORYRU